MDTPQSSGNDQRRTSLGRKLLSLLLKFCISLILIPAAFAGIGALIGVFAGSPMNAAAIGFGLGVILGASSFVATANTPDHTSHHFGGYGGGGFGGFGGGDGGGGGGCS